MEKLDQVGSWEVAGRLFNLPVQTGPRPPHPTQPRNFRVPKSELRPTFKRMSSHLATAYRALTSRIPEFVFGTLLVVWATSVVIVLSLAFLKREQGARRLGPRDRRAA